MSFSKDCARFGDRLVGMVDAGVSVKDAAVAVGLSRHRCYAILRAVGQPKGRPRGRGGTADRGVIVAVFTESGSINAAAKACGVVHSVARRILVEEGLVTGQRLRPVGKPQAKRRCLELMASGWSAARAAREVGVNERTVRDWRDGIRKTRDTRIHPDGTVVDYTTGTRYKTPVTDVTCGDDAQSAADGRYLCLQDRLAIADGLLTKQPMQAIADGIGKHVCTVSRELRRHSVAGQYLPYQAHRAATANRARPKQSKLVTNTVLRAAVEDGLARRLSPEQISHRLRRDYPDDESMRVSHETIYQALYFQARGGLKKEVQQALRTGRTRRKPHRVGGQRTHRFVDPMIMISDRPAEVADRAVPGHWESQWFCQAA